MKKSLVFILILFFTPITFAKILVHGHRGARAARPENTMSAFKYALSVGVDVIELDLAVTKDNELVISHDLYLNNKICLDKNNKRLKKQVIIRDQTLAQIKTYDCGSLKNPRFKKQVSVPKAQIPSLNDVFQWINTSKNPAAKNIMFNIETKIKPTLPQLSPSPKDFALLVVEAIKKHNMVNRTIVQSFDYRTLFWVKKLEPKIQVSQLTDFSLPDLVGAAKGIQAEWVSPNVKWINKEMVERLHKNNIKVVPWTANSKNDWQHLIDIKADAIITDDPKALITYLKSKKLR